ncbi:MAG TPA: tRNA uridine-5-carboxymethylaminomethyl(34) synthesis GTPase MnmE [Blastocatellia bacterium]|nr:tRNA uridine-5-carboxymethylaminomethyl(34) synthesis GTPase MnmE [Blastocatellia bacterium]
MFSDDTIAAISTPPGRGGIGVIRLSGPDALNITNSLFRFDSTTTAAWEPNRARFGYVIDPISNELIDEVVVTYYKGPHSYTGEDTAEISCHGSPVILSRVLRIAVEKGARLAEPGEFTFRAFFNGKIDLTQAQAVRDLINAQTQYQARVATRQLDGELSRRLAPFKDSLIEVIVHLESSIEFVEEDISPEKSSSLQEKLANIVDGLNEIAGSFTFGRYVREGFDLAIVGRPNVGKSSIFNRLVGVDRAIVTPLPGTTRDALYENTSISGVPVRLIDTAGIRETSDLVESIGVTRSKSAIADADISLLVLDASDSLNDDDLSLLNHVPVQYRIVALNKSDLPQRISAKSLRSIGDGITEISALTGEGFDSLTEKIFDRLAGAEATERDGLILTDARQHDAVRRAIEHATRAVEMIRQREHEEILLLSLRGTLSTLGEITGETLTEDILSQIFSTFCIGK